MDGDTRERDPVMTLASSDPLDLSVGEHIDASTVLMVVHVEDQTALRSAVGWECRQVTPAAMLDQAAHKAQASRLCNSCRAI